MEYILNVLNAFSNIGPLQALGDGLARALGAVTAPMSRLVDNPSEALATMDPTMVVVLGAISFILILLIGYHTLFPA